MLRWGSAVRLYSTVCLVSAVTNCGSLGRIRGSHQRSHARGGAFVHAQSHTTTGPKPSMRTCNERTERDDARRRIRAAGGRRFGVSALAAVPRSPHEGRGRKEQGARTKVCAPPSLPALMQLTYDCRSASPTVPYTERRAAVMMLMASAHRGVRAVRQNARTTQGFDTCRI